MHTSQDYQHESKDLKISKSPLSKRGVGNTKITVWFYSDRISLFYTLAPFFNKGYSKQLEFTRNIEDTIKKDKNRYLIIIRNMEKNSINLLERLRDKYEIIAVLDDMDGVTLWNGPLLSYVDCYFKMQLHKDLHTYLRPVYGKQWFRDRYHKECGIIDQKETFTIPVPSEDLLRNVRLYWNLGAGIFPLRINFQKICSVLIRKLPSKIFSPHILYHFLRSNYRFEEKPVRKIPQVFARYTMHSKHKTIEYQRKKFYDLMQGDNRFLSGVVPGKQYCKELSQCSMTLSPFGKGEVCWRDFECVINSSLMLKPCMEGVQTYPSVYKDGETYIALDWYGADLFEKVDYYLNNHRERIKIMHQALDNFNAEMVVLDEKVEEILGVFSQY